MAAKPLAVRILEQRHIAHELFTFDPAIRSAELVARETGMPPAAVYKTLVVESDPPKGRPNLVLMPSHCEVDLKALAAAIGAKKLRMASHKDAERYTGLQVGGISALALLGKGFPVFIDARALTLGHLLVSAGQRGADVRLAVADLLALTGGRPIAGCSTPAG
ncbi:MAG: aminoacyl-tRNA deacylase [Chloroflexi bacterium]|nr:aminoacyl-tRNA deacylase [Chloroflexota bacterium]